MRPNLQTSHLLHRRESLGIAGSFFGHFALRSLLADSQQYGASLQTHRPGKVSRVIFLFMNGGPSQIDTFDPKPNLAKWDGKSYQGELRVSSGERVPGELWSSEFKFQRYGQSGIEISEIYPQLSRFADDLCVIRSMHTSNALHAPAMLNMNTGRSQLGGASLGAWIDYGLGAINENLPRYVVMLDHRGGPVVGHGNWTNGSLPVNSPILMKSPQQAFANLDRKQAFTSPDSESQMKQLLRELSEHHRIHGANQKQLDQRIAAYELAWRMQRDAPEAVDLSQETVRTKARYGLDREATRPFATRCLLARRLLERGVRFIQIYSGGGQQTDTWDAHSGNVERHRRFATETDQPIAALLEDLKQTGLWNETLVIWGGEFGRMPMREQDSNGRDHNPYGFTMWLAGAGVRAGHVVGATDELGLQAVERPCSVADLHATILSLLGMDHQTLKFYEDGSEIGLTGPEPCRVIQEALTT